MARGDLPTRSATVPELEFDLAVDAEKELLKFKRGIEKLLPDEARKELEVGIAAGGTCGT